MNIKHTAKIAKELHLKESQVFATAMLLSDDATIPFIARYRKEKTGGLDEVEVATIRDRIHQLENLDKRRELILKSLKERELITSELQEKIAAAETMFSLEDIYLPFKPKRRTRAAIAREKGLEPLAGLIFKQVSMDLKTETEKFIDNKKGVVSCDDALKGARDIIAEWINEDQKARKYMRNLFSSKACIRAKVVSGKEEEAAKYKDYFNWEEPAKNAPSHRVLAMMRGEKESLLILKVLPDDAEALMVLEKLFVKSSNAASEQVRDSVRDSYKRLMSPSMQTEISAYMKDRADKEAIKVFAENLRELLLAPPLGQKKVMAIDPGFRTGCKVVCLDRQGRLLHNDVIYPHQSKKNQDESADKIRSLCEKFDTEVIAIGNGTAGRETELFVRSLSLECTTVMVNESGASIYSASETARKEFPDHDVTVRGTVSIGRRLVDPLAELVKIDPKSMGVGQYQHDVDEKLLKQKLDDVVMSCVNMVGVELNTASQQLLTYVSGLGPKLAQNILDYRNKFGCFNSRKELLSVSGLGPKAFEQAAGFLRIRGGENPLDGGAVHPESYLLVESMAEGVDCSVGDLIKDDNLRKKINIEKYVSKTVGLPTLNDIMAELSKPGRDPREKFELFSFADGINSIKDLRPGMNLPGIVTNVTNFGAFVDIGVHQDGLVHISQLADQFVKNPAQFVKVHQKVSVLVLEVDINRKRISLSMKNQN